MLQAMRGRLTEDPDIQVIYGEDKRRFEGVILTLLYEDDRPNKPEGQCQLIAWNESARKLSRYRKGEEIEFIGRLNTNQSNQGVYTGISYTLVHLDESKTVVAAMEKLFEDSFIPKDSLSTQIRNAEQQKADAERQQKDPMQKEAIP